MADEKVSALDELTILAPEDLFYVVDDPGGIPTSKKITGANLLAGIPVSFVVAASDETSDLTTGTAKVTFRMPFAMTLTEVRGSVNDAPTGSALQADINEAGVSILSTPITIDAGDTTSEDATTPPVISDNALADNAEITIDIDAVGSTNPAKGLKITLIGTRS